jgi:ribosomal protein L37AE/L43A
MEDNSVLHCPECLSEDIAFVDNFADSKAWRCRTCGHEFSTGNEEDAEVARILRIPAEQLYAEMRAEGLDPEAEAAKAREIAMRAIEQSNKRWALLDELLVARRLFDEAAAPGSWIGAREQEQRASDFGMALDCYIDERIRLALEKRNH